MRPGKQLFPLNYNNIINNNNIKNNIKAIKIIVRETYGGNRTYINQIMFYEQNAQQVNDLISGNELNKIYKNQKKLIQNYSNNQLNKQFIINKNNSFNSGKKRNKNNQLNEQKKCTTNCTTEEYIKQNNSQTNNINNKQNKNKKGNCNETFKDNKSFIEKEKGNEVKDDIYNEEGEIIDIEGEGEGGQYNDVKSNEYLKEEENDIEEINNENENNNEENQILNYKKVSGIKMQNKKKSNDNIRLKIIKNNKNYHKQSLEINLNENLTPNKYLKRVKSLTSGNNSNISNINFHNFGLILNNNSSTQNYSNIDNYNNNLNLLNYSNNKNFKNKTENSTKYNQYIKNINNEENNINDNYDEGISDIPLNSMQIGNDLPSNLFNKSKILINNNFKNNLEYEEQLQQQILDISDINKRMNKTYDNNEYDNKSKLRPSFISNNQSNNLSILSPKIENEENPNEQNNYYNENYNNNINKYNYFSERNNNNINLNNFNINNNISNNSQRFSIISNYDNNKNNIMNNIMNNKNKLIKEKLDYLEGNIIEIRNEINLISENISFLSSKEFIINNFKEQIIQICEEIYNEYYNNDKNNNSFITNSIITHQNKNNKLFLENKINSKLDEKLGNIKNNLFDKFLQPAINEIGNSMKKNIEQIKTEVDSIGNTLYKQKDILKNSSSIIQNDEDENMEFKTSSKLRNAKFDEINKIGENLYNKLIEKEKKLEQLKKEKILHLIEENEKSDIDVEYNNN